MVEIAYRGKIIYRNLKYVYYLLFLYVQAKDMDTKLTLKLNDSVIERAKKYASNKNLSLSRLIENYLDLLTSEKKNEFEISPFVRSI